MGPVLLWAAIASVLAAPALAAETQVMRAGGVDATLSLPDGAEGDVPAVVMMHGFASSKDEVRGIYAREAAALAEHGIPSIRLSFRGFGKSDGDTGASTIDDEVEDALAAVEFLRSQDGVDRGRLGLLGFSLGGGVAVLAAAEHPDWFKALATWSSVGDFDTDMKNSLGQATFDQAHEERIVGLDPGWCTIALKSEFFASLKAHSITEAFEIFDLPTLAVAGSEDFSAAYVEAFAAAGSASSEAWIVPGADHIYGVLSTDQSTADEIIAHTAEWFALNAGVSSVSAVRRGLPEQRSRDP